MPIEQLGTSMVSPISDLITHRYQLGIGNRIAMAVLRPKSIQSSAELESSVS